LYSLHPSSLFPSRTKTKSQSFILCLSKVCTFFTFSSWVSFLNLVSWVWFCFSSGYCYLLGGDIETLLLVLYFGFWGGCSFFRGFRVWLLKTHMARLASGNLDL
jgi:hypothetical protein